MVNLENQLQSAQLLPIGDAEAIRYLKQAINSGKHWYIALLEAIGLWNAAEEIHTDIKKGFIRAEVLAYDQLIEAGTYQEARKKGVVRLEGKTYEVKNGDIINFRFNV